MWVDVGSVWRVSGRFWAGRLGHLLFSGLSSLPSAFLLTWAYLRGGAGRICLLLAGFASSARGGRRCSCSDGILPTPLLADVRRGGDRAGLLLILVASCLLGRVEGTFLCLHVWRGHPQGV